MMWEIKLNKIELMKGFFFICCIGCLFILGGVVMVMRKFFNCNKYGISISSWSDGNPNYFDGQRVKQYTSQPDHEKLSRWVGKDSPHLCLGCGAC